MMRRITLAVLAAVGLIPGLASANATAQFQVSATVVNTCTIAGPTGNAVTFSSWNNLASAQQTSTLTVACTKNNAAGYPISLDSANGWVLKNAGDAVTVAYAIYQPDANGGAATTTAWNATNKYTYSPTTSAAKTLTFTTVLQPADVQAGTYTDTVTATIYF